MSFLSRFTNTINKNNTAPVTNIPVSDTPVDPMDELQKEKTRLEQIIEAINSFNDLQKKYIFDNHDALVNSIKENKYNQFVRYLQGTIEKTNEEINNDRKELEKYKTSPNKHGDDIDMVDVYDEKINNDNLKIEAIKEFMQKYTGEGKILNNSFPQEFVDYDYNNIDSSNEILNQKLDELNQKLDELNQQIQETNTPTTGGKKRKSRKYKNRKQRKTRKTNHKRKTRKH